MAKESSIIESSLLRGAVKLLQPAKGFHASIDAVFLAAAVVVKDKHKVLDVGCGVGSAGLCVMARHENIHLTGVDIQQDLVDLAHQNARLNGWSDRCKFFHGDLRAENLVPDNEFNAVLMNPPYQEGGTHMPSPVKNKAVSHGEDASGATLADWIKYAHRKLKQGGTLTLIHRADRLDDVISSLTKKRWFGSLTVFPLYPHAGEDARRVIVSARKERYAPLKLTSGLVLHARDGRYTAEAEALLTRTEPLPLSSPP